MEDILLKYSYIAPNKHYRNLFREAAKLKPGPIPSYSCNAGWLVPDNSIDCEAVFIAHSTRSAIWLLREILPESTISDASWNSLFSAAHSLANHPDEPPSSHPPTPSTSHSHPPTPSSSHSHPPTPSIIEPELDDTNILEEQRPDILEEQRPDILEEQRPDILDEQRPRTTVTNNNRLSDRRRGLKRRRSIGLIKPHNEAPPVEHAAYASILPKDESIIAWVIKQDVAGSPLYDTTRTPYATAITMVQNAHALGNQAARSHAASFVKSWRSLGTPFPTRVGPTPSMIVRSTFPLQGLSQCSALDSAFRHAWDTINFLEGQFAAVHIQYRWAMASLARAYAEKIIELKQQDDIAGRGQSRRRDGKGKLRTQAKRNLLQLVSPNATPSQQSIFGKRLQRATRWYEAADKLGWGSLCLMPHDQITNTWVEQTLRVAEWHVWLELVKKINPDAYAASKAFDSWLGSESIAGGSIDDKEPLRIEAELFTTTYDVEEVRDSEAEEDDDDLAPIPSIDPAGQFHQLTLPELFQPLLLCRSVSII